MVYLFRAAAKTNKDYDERQSQQQLELFNSKFENYNKNDNTIIDLVSLINLVYDTNETNYYDEGMSVRLVINLTNNKISNLGDLGGYLIVPEVNCNLNKNEVLNCRNSNNNDGDTISTLDLINLKLNDKSLSDSILKSDELLGGMKTVYTYTFKCKSISYDKKTGRVEKIEFKLNDQE